MKTIKLFNTTGGWMADFVGDDEVRAAFGTTTIPTAFTSSATEETVLAAIRKLNPSANVGIGFYA